MVSAERGENWKLQKSMVERSSRRASGPLDEVAEALDDRASFRRSVASRTMSRRRSAPPFSASVWTWYGAAAYGLASVYANGCFWATANKPGMTWMGAKQKRRVESGTADCGRSEAGSGPSMVLVGGHNSTHLGYTAASRLNTQSGHSLAPAGDSPAPLVIIEAMLLSPANRR
jgi:hypothetical protein